MSQMGIEPGPPQREDQGYLNPKLAVLASAVQSKHSSKELSKQHIYSYFKYLHMSPQQ